MEKLQVIIYGIWVKDVDKGDTPEESGGYWMRLGDGDLIMTPYLNVARAYLFSLSRYKSDEIKYSIEIIGNDGLPQRNGFVVGETVFSRNDFDLEMR